MAKTETLLKFLPLVHETLGTAQEETKLAVQTSPKRTKPRPKNCPKTSKNNSGLPKQGKKAKTVKRKRQIETANSAFEKHEVKRVKTEDAPEVPLIHVSKIETPQLDTYKRVDANLEQFDNKLDNSSLQLNEVNFTPSTMNMENQFVDFRNIFNQQMQQREFNPTQFSHEFGMDSFSYNPSINLNNDDKGNNYNWSCFILIIYHIECENLEHKLLMECDMVIEDINKEMDHLQSNKLLSL